MLAHGFLHAIDFGTSRARKCKIVTTRASSGGAQARVGENLMAVFAGGDCVCPDNPVWNDMTRRASNTDVFCVLGRLGAGVGLWRVASAAKSEWLEGVGMGEVFIFPSAMVERSFPFGGNFGVTIAATLVLGQTNAGNRFELGARCGAGKGYIVGTARVRKKPERAENSDGGAQKIESRTHAIQNAGRSGRLSMGMVNIGQSFSSTFFTRREFQVVVDHTRHEVLEGQFGLPTQDSQGFRRICEK